MKFLFIGDVVGKCGRTAVEQLLPDLKKEFGASFVVINGENVAGGNGLTGPCARDLLKYADVITAGDHVWDQKGFESDIRNFDRVLRPANFSNKQPGKGFGIYDNPIGGQIAVLVLLGKVFMRESSYCPFETADKIISSLPGTVKSIIVDFHAEATSEKIAMAEFLDGRVTAVIGTHTHVRTDDARILPNGTAALSDAGMVGAQRSILGRDIDAVLKKFTTGMPVRFPVVEQGTIRLDGCVVSYNHLTGKADSISGFSRCIDI